MNGYGVDLTGDDITLTNALSAAVTSGSGAAVHPGLLRTRLESALGPEDSARLKAPAHRLVVAAEEHIPSLLAELAPITDVSLDRVANDLAGRRGWSREASRSTVDTWAVALGLAAVTERPYAADPGVPASDPHIAGPALVPPPRTEIPSDPTPTRPQTGRLETPPAVDLGALPPPVAAAPPAADAGVRLSALPPPVAAAPPAADTGVHLSALPPPVAAAPPAADTGVHLSALPPPVAAPTGGVATASGGSLRPGVVWPTPSLGVQTGASIAGISPLAITSYARGLPPAVMIPVMVVVIIVGAIAIVLLPLLLALVGFLALIGAAFLMLRLMKPGWVAVYADGVLCIDTWGNNLVPRKDSALQVPWSEVQVLPGGGMFPKVRCGERTVTLTSKGKAFAQALALQTTGVAP